MHTIQIKTRVMELPGEGLSGVTIREREQRHLPSQVSTADPKLSTAHSSKKTIGEISRAEGRK